MIFGIGCDIIDIKRIQCVIDRYNNKFLNRIFTNQEINLGQSIKNRSYYAKRFSAKEAYAKATGYGIGRIVSFKDIEILNNKNGTPYFNKHPLQNRNIRAFLSISDEIQYAMSYVILDRI